MSALLKRIGAGLVLAGLAFGGGCSGNYEKNSDCDNCGKLYFPAAKYTEARMMRNEDERWEIKESCNLGALLRESESLPIVLYRF